MEPTTPLSYKQRQKIRKKMIARRGELNPGQRNKLIGKLQAKTPASDTNQAQSIRTRLAALQGPLRRQALEKADFDRDKVEGIKDYAGASKYFGLKEKVAGLSDSPATDPKRVKLEARLASQTTLRKRLGDARRAALPAAERAKLKYTVPDKERVGTKNGGTPTPGQSAGSEPKPPTGKGPKPTAAEKKKRKNRTP